MIEGTGSLPLLEILFVIFQILQETKSFQYIWTMSHYRPEIDYKITHSFDFSYQLISIFLAVSLSL